MDVIYHDLTKRSFRYDQKTKMFQQHDIQECELITRHLLCQDAIFHRIIDTTGSDTQKNTPLLHRWTNDQEKSTRKDRLVPNRQNNDLWVKRPSPDEEIGQGQNFNKYELVNDKYLKNLGKMRT